VTVLACDRDHDVVRVVCLDEICAGVRSEATRDGPRGAAPHDGELSEPLPTLVGASRRGGQRPRLPAV